LSHVISGHQLKVSSIAATTQVHATATLWLLAFHEVIKHAKKGCVQNAEI
jgi:hypothetical protein